MNPRNFFAELKRRNVYKVAVAYAVVAWLLIQAASIVLPTFEAPAWTMKVLIAALSIGFPLAVVLAWAFEITPKGIKRESEVLPDESITAHTGRKLVGITIALAAIAAGLLTFQFLRTKRAVTAAPTSSIAAVALAAPIKVSDKSIAVLPFENLSSDKENAYFAEGVQDEILTRLAKVADLKVISRTSTQRFKSSPNDLPQIAKQLGVLHILEGSVQKSGDSVRVNVQLINAVTDAHLWAEIYDRKLTDIFTVESEIAKTIADTLQAKLTGSERNAIAQTATEDPLAHELYTKGHHFWGLRGDNLPRAIEFYNQAIARDPNYALAYAGLGETYILLPYYTGADPNEVRPKGRAAARKALELNPNLAEAHNAMGKILATDDIDLQQAIREYQRAIELSPNYAGAHHWLGNGPLLSLARFDEAIAEGKRSVELDPLSAVNLVDLGLNYTYAHRFREAEAEFKKALELDPTFAYVHWSYGIALQTSGDLEGARAQYAAAHARANDTQAITMRAQLSAKMGQPAEAVKALATLEELAKHQYVEAYNRALLYLSLGQKDEALAALEQSYAERDGDSIGSIKVDSLLDPLRGDPRFEALVQKVVGEKK